MLTVCMPARNDRRATAECLKSLFYSTRSIAASVRFVLIDDASEEGLSELFVTFRRQVASEVQVARFEERQHYTGVFNYGLSQAAGDFLFVSNDMALTPSFLATVLAVSALSETIGVVRGTSGFVSGHPEHRVSPPFPPRDYEDIRRFSAYVAERQGLSFTQDALLSGDAVLVKRRAREATGLFDPRFFGYFSDVDYGLRVRLAGFSLVCAKGAWLHHEGAGHLKEEARVKGAPLEQTFEGRYRLVQEDYLKFRAKWDPSLPERFAAENLDCEALFRGGPIEEDHGVYRPHSSLQVL